MPQGVPSKNNSQGVGSIGGEGVRHFWNHPGSRVKSYELKVEICCCCEVCILSLGPSASLLGLMRAE